MPIYKNYSDRFKLKAFDYQQQFCHIYAGRLKELSNLLLPKIEKRWNLKPMAIKDLCTADNDTKERCCLIGTIYRHQVHKPSILKEISEENQLAPQPPREHYADTDDKLVLEDELQRIRLTGHIKIDEVATGVVCAVRGHLQEEDDNFFVDEIIFHESGPQKPLNYDKIESEKRRKGLLVLISGLNQMDSHLFVDAINLFQHWLCDKLDNDSSREERRRLRLIVAGNSMRSMIEQRQSAWQNRPIDSTALIHSVKELDRWLAAWSSYLPVDIMPGACDATNHMMPQQSFHACMFPMAGSNENFQSVTNPYNCRIDDVHIIGTSGQNVNDLLRCTSLENAMDALRSTLKWGHLAPTAPDTLACYPYLERDPFIIKHCPHIYFVGNCETYSSELYFGTGDQRTRLICIPDFSKTQSIVTVDLNTLKTEEISFRCEEELIG